MSRQQRPLAALLFMAPALVLFLVFLLYPILFSVALSFFDWTGFTTRPFQKFAGLSNYARMWVDPIFGIALKNTFIFTLLSLFFQNLVGLGIALLVFYGNVKGSLFCRSVVFFPTMLSSVVIGLVWRRIFMIDGLLNQILALLLPGRPPFVWLANPVTPIYIITLINVWQWLGYNMVIYYAGLQGVDNELIDSAEVDGANWFQKITRVVVPQLYKTISVAVILNIIGGFKVFDLVYVVTGGGPAHSSEVVTSHIYYQSFSVLGTNRMGYASALAVVLTAIVLVFAVVRIFVDWRTE
jgi:ABC-type sugar transport system permease subunit